MDLRPAAGRVPLGALLLFSLLVTVYTITGSGGFHIVDEVSLFAVTESLAQRGQVDTNAIAWTQWVNSPGEVLGAFGPQGEVYSKKGPAPAFVAAPWYSLVRLMARLLAGLGLPVGLLQGALLWNPLVTAATAVLLGGAARRLGYAARTGVFLGLLFGLGTIAWPYANHLFGEPLSALSLLLCLTALLGITPTTPHHQTRRHLLLAGVGAGLAVATVTAHAVLVAALGLYALHRLVRASSPAPGRARSLAASLLIFVLPILAAVLLLGLYNAVRFGSPLETGYHFDAGEGFTTPIGAGLWGLLVSPYRGLFWHTPLYIASTAAAGLFLRRHRAEGVLIGALTLIGVALYSVWWMWWGGFAWGPRFLVPLGPFWVLLLAPAVALLLEDARGARSRAAPQRAVSVLLVVCALLSMLVQLSAVVVNYVNWEIRLRQIFPTDWRDPLAFGPPAQAPADWWASPVLGQWRLMADNFVANTDLAWLWADGTLLWWVPAIGLASIATLGFLLAGWLRTTDTPHAPRPVAAVAIVLPVAAILLWLVSTAAHPRYGEEDSGYRAILAEIGARAGPADGIVTVTPFHYQIPMNWLGGVEPGGLPIYGYATDSADHEEARAVLNAALARHPRLWYVSAGLPPADPANTVERWLADHAHKVDDHWYDDFRLVRYAPWDGTDGIMRGVDAPLADDTNRIVIEQAQWPAALSPGDLLPVLISFRVETAVDPLRWFVQLLGPDGVPVAQLDTAPDDGYASAADLPPGVELVERAGLALPDALPSGTYRLIAGLYNPTREGAPRLRTASGADTVELGQVRIQ